jgi:NAD(P)-dependent dehydrogenase (short-subunit alcohol dehydrogenase family)
LSTLTIPTDAIDDAVTRYGPAGSIVDERARSGAAEDPGHHGLAGDGLNNAGLGTAVPALRESPEQFRQVIDVNLLGAYWMAQAAARVMRPGSSIVNIASVLGLITSTSPRAAYAASKAGLIGLTRDLAQQWSGRLGIRVNALAPGYFASEMTDQIPGEKLLDVVRQLSPLQRLGEQPELDAAVIFLASPASSYITGVTLAVDGGMSMR